MNPFLLTLLCGLLVSAASAQMASPVVGFLTLHLQPGTNFIGFALQPAMERQTTFTFPSSDRHQIQLQGALTDPAFGAGPRPTHAVEVVSAGAGEGFSSVIIDIQADGNRLTLAEPVPAEVPNGAPLKIWRLWTLSEMFGTENQAGLTGAEAAGGADLVLLPNGEGFDTYFYCTGGKLGQGWRREGAGPTDQADVPIPFGGGLALFARSAKSVILAGQVKPGRTQIQLRTGHNYVANLCPVHAAGDNASSEGRTLANSGLAAGLQGAAVSEQADLVLLWTGSGYDAYFHATSGPLASGWRKIGAGTAAQAQVPLPDGAFVILRRGPPLTLTLDQGNF
jgi:hypothetical protein